MEVKNKIGFPIVFFLAIIIAVAFVRGVNSQTADFCGPYPAPDYPGVGYPVDPCGNVVPSSCKFLDIYNAPLPNPWIFPTGDLVLCRAIIHDLYGYWIFDKDKCIPGPDGDRCVRGMFQAHSTVRIEGPKPFYDVQLYGQYRNYLPDILKRH